MYIYPIQQNYSQQPAFNGLTKKLSRTIRPLNLDKMIDAQVAAGKSTVVGQLPPEIFKYIRNLPAEEKKVAIKEIFDAFAEVAKVSRNYSDANEARFEPLKKVFEKYGIAEEGKFYVQDTRINGSDTLDYVIQGLKKDIGKTFFFRTNASREMINAQSFIGKHVGNNTKYAKLYCADPVTGYIISPNMSELRPLKVDIRDIYNHMHGCGMREFPVLKDAKQVSETEMFGFKPASICEEHGYLYGHGGNLSLIIKNLALNESKVARYTAKQVAKAKDKVAVWNDLYANAKHLDEPQRIAGLASSIHMLPKEVQDEYLQKCLNYNNTLVDKGLASTILGLENKYEALKYLEKLMERKNPEVQEFLIDRAYGFLDSKGTKAEQFSKLLYIYKANILPEVRGHIAYMLKEMPREQAMAEARELAQIKDYNTAVRVLEYAKKINDCWPAETRLLKKDRQELLDLVRKNNPEVYEKEVSKVQDVLYEMNI